MARCAGSRAIRLRGVDVTLRTWTEGAKDADYEDPTWIPTETTIKAMWRLPRGERRFASEAGEDVLIDAIALVTAGNAPVIARGERRPEIDGPDGFPHEVRIVGPAKGGLREIMCRRMR